MKSKRVYGVAVIVCAITLFLFVGGGTAADNPEGGQEVQTVGTVNDFDQLVSEDGTIYEIDITDAGNSLVEEVGKKVEVTGIIEDLEGVKSISVSSYKVIE
jgi:hypothetical protein